jgi:hypothetical protein
MGSARRNLAAMPLQTPGTIRPADNGALTDDDTDKWSVSDPEGGARATFCAG